MERKMPQRSSLDSVDLTRITFREEPHASDLEAVHEIVISSGFFSQPEVEVAIELVGERLSKGVASGYFFLFADMDGRTIGYACFGPVACTVHSFDVYWIAVLDEMRGNGLGREILWRIEEKMNEMGGRRIYVETSSREEYDSTRSFYRRCGYTEEAVLKDFYSAGDHKVIYLKVL